MVTANVEAQYKPGKERGDATKRAKGQMEGNQIRATVFNFGQSGREGDNSPSQFKHLMSGPKIQARLFSNAWNFCRR